MILFLTTKRGDFIWTLKHFWMPVRKLSYGNGSRHPNTDWTENVNEINCMEKLTFIIIIIGLQYIENRKILEIQFIYVTVIRNPLHIVIELHMVQMVCLKI